jgi:hypothetical protein
VATDPRLKGETPRISCTLPWTRLRVRLSSRKGAWSSRNPRNFTGNRGRGGTLRWFPLGFRLVGILGVRSVVSHISRKTSEIPRISCTLPWTRLRVRLSLRKGAWSLRNPPSLTGNRGYGAPGLSCLIGEKLSFGLRPVFFGPRTPWRTWGTRPGTHPRSGIYLVRGFNLVRGSIHPRSGSLRLLMGAGFELVTAWLVRFRVPSPGLDRRGWCWGRNGQ